MSGAAWNIVGFVKHYNSILDFAHRGGAAIQHHAVRHKQHVSFASQRL